MKSVIIHHLSPLAFDAADLAIHPPPLVITPSQFPALLCALFLPASMAEGVVVNMTNESFGSGSIAPSQLTSTAGSTFRGGFINGALFRDPSVTGSTGSGVFRDLFRLNPPNGKGNVIESGYNRETMDSKIPNGFDPMIRMKDLVLDASGNSYIFVLDINEAHNKERFLSLDDFKVWVGGTTDPGSLPNSLAQLQSTLGIPIYDMNPAGSSNVVLMDASLSSGSGGGDAFIFIPKSMFGGNPNPDAFVYLYAAMGGYTAEPGFGAGATHEQISLPGKGYLGGSGTDVIGAGVPVGSNGAVPEFSSSFLFLFATLGTLARRQR